ncbi:MAG: NAD-dependent epimerase/dehydratase family protein, partial [Eubacteriales bacterium]|nr:NAD-dependent epimerase/dehydratase family protein [Eubacteriales bacterium]
MKRVIITGASGMLGATLAAKLAEAGIAVLALIRPGSPKRRNLPAHPLIRVLEWELNGLAALTPESAATKYVEQTERADQNDFFEAPFDCCYHFAWNGTYGDAREDIPWQEANVRHTLDAVAMAARMGCRKFIGAGSQAEYGPVEAEG